MNAAPPDEAIQHLLDWESRQAAPRRLALWIVVAVVLHAAALVAFRLVPPSVDRSEPSSEAVIALALPGTQAGETLARWLDLRDPALFAAERSDRANRFDPAPPPYRPSFMDVAAPALPMPERSERLLPPLPTSSSPVAISGGRRMAEDTPKEASSETEIRFSGALENRAVVERGEFTFVARPGDLLQPAEFLIAVGPDGHVLHGFEQTGTTFEPLNAQASAALHELRFEPGPGIQWGAATFYWGDDVERRREP